MIKKDSTQRFVKRNKHRYLFKKWYAPTVFISKGAVFYIIEYKASITIKELLQKHDGGMFFFFIVTGGKEGFKIPSDTHLSRLPRDARKVYGDYMVEKFETSIVSLPVKGSIDGEAVQSSEQLVIDEIITGSSGISEKVRVKEKYLNSRTESKNYVKRVDLFGDFLDKIDYRMLFIEALLDCIEITRTNKVPVYLVMSILVSRVKSIQYINPCFSGVYLDKKIMSFFVVTYLETLYECVSRKVLNQVLAKHHLSTTEKLSRALPSTSFVLNPNISDTFSHPGSYSRKISLLPLKRRFFFPGNNSLDGEHPARYSYCPFLGVSRLVPTVVVKYSSNHKLRLYSDIGLFLALEQLERSFLYFDTEVLDLFLDQISVDLEIVRECDLDSPLLEASYRNLIDLDLGLPCRSGECTILVEKFNDQGSLILNSRLGHTLSDQFFKNFTIITDVYYLNTNKVYPEYVCDFRGRLYIVGSLSITRSKLVRALVQF